MIRHGRSATDRRGIADLHGLKMTAFKGDRRRLPPWEDPGHPQAINLDPDGETPPRTFLYDEEQAKAFAAGEDIPALPTENHGGDLLTERDAAAYLGIVLDEFRDLVKSLRVPEADEKIFGVNHWYRSTLDEHGTSPGRGAGSGEARRDGAARQRMKAVVRSLPPGETVGITELARRAEVSLATARKFLRAPELQIIATFAQPIGTGLETWDAFLSDVRKLAGLKKYSGIAIRITEK